MRLIGVVGIVGTSHADRLKSNNQYSRRTPENQQIEDQARGSQGTVFRRGFLAAPSCPGRTRTYDMPVQ